MRLQILPDTCALAASFGVDAESLKQSHTAWTGTPPQALAASIEIDETAWACDRIAVWHYTMRCQYRPHSTTLVELGLVELGLVDNLAFMLLVRFEGGVPEGNSRDPG